MATIKSKILALIHHKKAGLLNYFEKTVRLTKAIYLALNICFGVV
jgi:hypothetical protein